MSRKALVTVLAGILMAAPHVTYPQAADDIAATQNATKARAALNAMVQAMGGQAWLNLKNEMRQEHVAAFFHGQPDLGTTLLWDFHQWPDHDRVEVTKHRDVVEFYIGRQGWEVTYRGKKPMQQDLLDDFLRRRDHSIEMAVKVWMNDPKTILIYEGQHMVERKLGEQVTLISPQNEAITILIDEQTHLPLSRSFQWRDPVYKDKNVDLEEYADYHTIDGFPTAFSITRFKNDEMTRQYYVDHVEYNRQLPADFWDVDATARKIKR
ncbi:MAG TPA: hypothetical protein VMU48_10130 [Terracidiphilus sp.]|nr:hypothetical protein [Terracidiphilus sp.]